MSRRSRFDWLSLRGRFGRRSATREFSAATYSRRLRFEPLEDRRLLAITVNTLIDVNANDGLTTLREAIAAAVPGDSIGFSVAGTINLSSLGQITINKNLTINGPGANVLTINAFDLTPATNNGDGSRIFNVDDSTATVRTVAISGLTLTGGDVSGPGGAIRNVENLTLGSSTVTGNAAFTGSGGGLYNGGATAVMTVSGCTVSNNVAGFGGGMLNHMGSLTVANSTISGNTVTGNTGGIQNNFGTLNVTGSTIIDNSGLGAGGGISTYFDIATNITGTTIRGNNANVGGGLWSRESTVTITASTISGNTAQKGGGIYHLDDTLTVNTTTIDRNTATVDGAGIFSVGGTANVQNSLISHNNAGVNAGGIEKRSGTLNITNSTLRSNSSNKFGGAIWSYNNTTNLTSSTISGNRAGNDGATAGSGGGILQTYGTLQIASSTISGNASTGNGGGIYTYFGTLTVAHSTIVNNVVDEEDLDTFTFGRGGGIHVNGSAASIKHTIVALNHRGSLAGAPNDDIDGPVSAQFSLIGSNLDAIITNNGGNQIGTNASPVNPVIGPLLEQGGQATHALLVGSPAIDAGDPAAVGAPPNDQRGAPFVRVFNGDGIGTSRIDIGAYEKQTLAATNFVVDTLLDEVDGNYSAGDVSLREAIGLASGSGAASPTIGFANSLTAGGPAKIVLIRDVLAISNSVQIFGPGADLLTIDASGNDLTPGTMDSMGSGVFLINDFDAANFVSPQINSLKITNGDHRAAVYSYENLSLNGCTITGNNGGGIRNRLGSLTVSFGTISANFNFTGAGAGLFNEGTATIDHTTISGNTAETDGGGINNGGTLTLSSSTVSGNFAEDGAGIQNVSDLAHPMLITNSTISGNISAPNPNNGEPSGEGGGLYNDQGLVIIRNSTITNNTAPAGFGSGILSKANTNTRTEVTSSIVAGNTNSDVDFVEGAVNSFQSHGYNLIGPGNALANFNQPGDQTGVTNAKLGPLAANGGPTKTHSLLVTSPAIDLGDPAAVAGVGLIPLYDQRDLAFSRVYNGDGIGSTRIDIGAYESQPIPPAVFGDYSHNIVADAADYVLWRKNLFNEGPAYSGADGDGDGTIDQDDYGVWRANFGNTLPPGAGSGEAAVALVAEPAVPAIQPSAFAMGAAFRKVVPKGEAIVAAGPVRTPVDPADFDIKVASKRTVRPPALARTSSFVAARQDDALALWLAARIAGCPTGYDDTIDSESPTSPADDHENEVGFDALDAAFASLAV